MAITPQTYRREVSVMWFRYQRVIDFEGYKYTIKFVLGENYYVREIEVSNDTDNKRIFIVSRSGFSKILTYQYFSSPRLADQKLVNTLISDYCEGRPTIELGSILHEQEMLNRYIALYKNIKKPSLISRIFSL